VTADLAVLVDPAGVPGGAEIAVAGGTVGEQVPGDDQDRPRDGDERLELAAASGDPPIALAEESVGLPTVAAASPRAARR